MRKSSWITSIVIVLSMLTSCTSNVVMKRDAVRIVLQKDMPEPVRLAAETLCRDFDRTIGFTPELTDEPEGEFKGVTINIIDDESVPDKSGLKPLDGFESHRVYSDGKNIFLYGKDMRGTIYAIYTFSEKVLGVPPLWYFSSWKPELKKSVRCPGNMDMLFKSPQVRYRAWFPNDEDLFIPWRKLSGDNDELWLETMLRLKLNTVELVPTVRSGYRMSHDADLLRKYGLVLTSHHMVALNNSFANWDSYWKDVRGMKAPALLIRNIDALKEFWQYNIETVLRNGQENLWQIAFRGKTDEPFWATFADAPETDKERAEVISRMVEIQYEMIREATGEEDPFVRMTFYDELSDLLAKGYLTPPSHSNMLWTFVAGRRDHYPYDDIVNFDKSRDVQLGYYMNLQFTSTGAHLAAAESPWKMEQNYRFVNSVAPLTFSVVNAGNLREFLMELSANAAMMWDFSSYDTDRFLFDFCCQYYGKVHARQAAALYREYYYDYWNQKPSEFPGMDRQFIFQDMRYARVFNQISKRFHDYDDNPLTDIGHERVPGRSFRITGENQVDSILNASMKASERFALTAQKCEMLEARLPEDRRAFFVDNLYVPCQYMEHLNRAMVHFLTAYKQQENAVAELTLAKEEILKGRDALYSSHRGVFADWYTPERLFGFRKILSDIDRIIRDLQQKAQAQM